MNRATRKVIAMIVAIEILVVLGLLGYIVSHSGRITSFVELSRSEIVANASSTLHYYYDLASEATSTSPKWLPYVPEYERSADGLNDRFDYEVPKPEGAYRIITLGDSWAFGMFVSTLDTYSELLEDRLNEALSGGELHCSGVRKFEVLNFGVGGYDIEYMVERLRLKGMKYEPDLIIPILKPDDFWLVNELFQPKLRALYDAYGNLSGTFENGVAVNPKQQLSDQAARELQDAHTEDDLNAYSSRSLETLASFYHDAVLFFVYGHLSGSQNSILESYAHAHDRVFIFDTIAVLQPEEKVPHDEHPGVLGHARFARELFDYLAREKVIPCQLNE